MKTKMFFLAGICAALAACSSDSDEVSSSPSNAPAILEVVSYKFVQEETDVVEWIEGEVQVLQHVENNKSTPLPMEYKSEERYKDYSLFVLTDGVLPNKVENLEDLKISVPIVDTKGKLFYSGGVETPLIFRRQQAVENGDRSVERISYTVPPYSIYEITRHDCGYKCTLTFYITLRDLNTDKKYPLKGKWTGIQFNSLRKTLSDVTDKSSVNYVNYEIE